MKKLLKISIILAIMFTFFMNISVYATESANQATESSSSTTTTTTTSNNSKKSSTQVSSVAAINQGDLSISDILNILLIAIGVVIVLLAIAIFIKLK